RKRGLTQTSLNSWGKGDGCAFSPERLHDPEFIAQQQRLWRDASRRRNVSGVKNGSRGCSKLWEPLSLDSTTITNALAKLEYLRLVVVDLDDTLWLGNCDRTHREMPYTGIQRCRAGRPEAVHCFDRYRQEMVFSPFPEGLQALHALRANKVRLAVASKSPADPSSCSADAKQGKSAAVQVLQALEILDWFEVVELGEGAAWSKRHHFESIQRRTGEKHEV
ncbi:unnamed protein product, partial [Chrysoparadoxa australica]